MLFRYFALFLAFGALSCGPSFQAVYECDVRFEHCYALDESAASPDVKKDCWRAWLHGYTYGQSRDRVEFAATRVSQLSLGPTLPSEEARDARPRRRAPAAAAPIPTNAFAPPPNVAASGSASASASAPPGDSSLSAARNATVRAPGADCSDGCARDWKSCHESCGSAPTSPARQGRTKDCGQCDGTYRACVPACLRDELTPTREPLSIPR